MSKIYQKLIELRESIRDAENKHTPTAVIADEPLKNLARDMPTSVDDMLKVSGIGKAFVSKYGAQFLNVIMSEQKPIKLTMICKEAKGTLKNLQARLTNVNRRNRMLYLPKPVQGKAIDLYNRSTAQNSALIDFLFSTNGNKLTVCDAVSENYPQYNRLIRAADSGARETGNNSLYVGYPFAIGKCGDLTAFNVFAPLVLFPVSLENTGGKIVMQHDDSREITFNSALILCYNKFNNISTKTMPSCGIDELRKREFESEILKFYSAEGIKIKRATSDGIIKYPSLTDKTFPEFGANMFEMCYCAVVGMFPMYSGEMQRDFDNIIDSGVMPPTLTELLESTDGVDDFYSESIELVDGETPIDSEADINYISELNVSQELAVEKAATGRALVMQGPPGTGKSQTITSMISDSVNKGKNVLVVSQKRAALSVIYSRLGRIARYAMFIDNSKDKQSFYGKLKAMFESESEQAPFNSVAFNRTAAAIDADTAELTEAARALCEDDRYGAPMLKIYRENFGNPFKIGEMNCSVEAADRTAVFRDNVPEALLECGYEEIKAAREYLSDEALLKTLGRYYELGRNFPWLPDLKRDMSASTVAGLVSELDRILDLYAYGKFKFKFKRALKTFIKENFIVFDRALYKRFKKYPDELYNGIKAYSEFFEIKVTADALDFCTRLYFGTVANVRDELGGSYISLVDELFRYCGYVYIDRFENERRDVIGHIDGFGTIVSRICAAIDKKRALTRDKTLNTLKTAFKSNMTDSKRRGDMMRAIDGKRRPAVSKFVEKFEFELFRGIRVFLMTPEAVSDVLPLRNDLFDLLVFDEASQIYIERGVPAIVRAKKLVVCGDHKQLRPSSLGDGRITVDEDEENEAVLEEESLLDLARFKFPEVMLSYHYRSRYEELIAFSNAAFYDGKLNISPDPIPSENPPISVYKVNGRWEDRVNAAEADKVLSLVSEFLDRRSRGVENDTLGVITFNALQRDYILDLIDKRCDADAEFKRRYLAECARREEGEDRGLFVKNIENVQGDERDRIIFSFAYAYNKKGVMSRNFGWLNRPGGENRLNVAISRARRKIDIVTSIIPSDLKIDDIKTTGVKMLRKYLDYAYCVSDGDRAGASAVLESFLHRDAIAPTGERSAGLKDLLADALEKAGLDVERDVGMGNYKIDVAVKDKKGDRVIGIECDDSVLKQTASTRERDVMRKRFLESRGWTVMRVWTCDWYADPDRVVRDILDKARSA